MATEHRVGPGAGLEIGSDGQRWYSSGCSCGWATEPCRTAVLADALAEQHVTLATRRPRLKS
jgi:hypothetical protein